MNPIYRIYSKPDCVHCTRAKTLLDARSIAYESILISDEPTQLEFLSKLNGWRSWPVVFALDSQGKPEKFIGGATELEGAVNASSTT